MLPTVSWSLARKRPPQAQRLHPPALGSTPLDTASQAGKPGDRTELPGRTEWTSGRRGARGPGTSSAPSRAARGRRQEGCCAAAHLREPPARSHPPRAPELGRARPVRRGAVPARGCAGRGRPPPGSRPNGVTCAGSRDDSRGRRLRGAGRTQRGSQAPGHPARPEGCAGRSHARDARGKPGEPGGAVAEARAAAAPARTAGSGYRRAAP